MASPQNTSSSEHGPWEELDFFGGLFISQARTRFVGHSRRASFALVYEMMLYDGATRRDYGATFTM